MLVLNLCFQNPYFLMFEFWNFWNSVVFQFLEFRLFFWLLVILFFFCIFDFLNFLNCERLNSWAFEFSNPRMSWLLNFWTSDFSKFCILMVWDFRLSEVLIGCNSDFLKIWFVDFWISIDSDFWFVDFQTSESVNFWISKVLNFWTLELVWIPKIFEISIPFSWISCQWRNI